LWIGEYGGDASAPGIVEYMTAQYDAAGAAGASTMYWSYDKSGGYGLLATDGTEKTVLTGVLTRPYPSRVAGDPGAYAFDAASSRFTFSWRADGSKLPTEIIVPSRVYPNGMPHVDCGGCNASWMGDVLSLAGLPSGAATVTITP
jgi:endoglycosylceramidase